MSSLENSTPSNTHWRSLAELADSPRFRQFVEAEFPAAADPTGMSRRRWLQLMGASLALAGVGGCRWDREEIEPFARRPDGRVPGEPEQFATAVDMGGSAIGLLVTSRDGRPIKIEGNPRHPGSLGAANVLAQASILELYDPDRSRNPRQSMPQGDVVQTWDKFAEFARSHLDALKEKNGAGLRILAEASSSPTLAALRTRFLEAFPEARWHEYEPLSSDNERDGSRLAFGRPYRTHYHLDRADVIACLDCDLLGSHPASLPYARAFADRREPVAGKMNRLYALESCFTITGAAADHRFAVGTRQIATVVSEISRLLGSGGAETIGPSDSDPLGKYVAVLASDLIAHRGRCVVAVGPAQPPAVHAAAHRINHALGNVGRTVSYTEELDSDRPSHVDALASLVADMNAGKVDTLVVLGGNPVYNAPVDLNFAEAYGKVAARIHLSLYRDETSRASTWHLPRAHFLESWDDARAYDGTYCIVQPLISPLYGGKSASELLALLLGEDPDAGYDLVRKTYQELFGEQDFERRWRKTVHDGAVARSGWKAVSPKPQAVEESDEDGPAQAAATGQLEIVFYRDASLYDGRFANNGWLQETPDPLTKLTWDNAAILNPSTARQLGIESDTLIKLKYGGRELEIPAYILPGQAEGSLAVTLGYGRTAVGQVGGDEDAGIPSAGFDTYQLRQSHAMHFDSGLTIEPTGKPYRLATTEDHHVIDTAGVRGRKERLGDLVREATIEHFLKHPDFARHAVHHPPLESLWEEWSYDGHRWGMSIDLSKCIGCNACLVACQAENNVPIVGKDLVLKGRQMHWIRVDRYFRGDPDDPEVKAVHQVVTCHHCENAPCEQVCPVAATVHSHEGLNDMVYNRCVGTRYCANNCPYKVRRFNYFSYHKDLNAPENEVKKMVFNPEVTVRTRGVMEKCTYCVQRIQAVKIDAKNESRPISEVELKTACQQACPTRAIEFGDLADRNSRVAKAQSAERAYAMLAELNVKPRTTYLAKIRNPNPDLESAHDEHDRHTG
jgi:molybdopterin-containing oxidoreductase family iron-sulfur binding subunit